MQILTVVVIFSTTVFSADKPKNIILMIGDGMGADYVSASLILLEQETFKRFPYSGFSITGSANKKITDSAAGATALSTGYRTNNYMLALDTLGNPLSTILEEAKAKGKSVGVVSTSSVTHATPAAFISHSDSRAKEFEIADQFVSVQPDVVIGGGTNFFLPLDFEGSREDNKNLADSLKAKGYEYFDNYLDLENYNDGNRIFALLDRDGIPPADKRDYGLNDLTSKAFHLLEKDEDGFFLLIEGSQIDWAGHDNNQEYALSELEDFTEAIDLVLDFAVRDSNTLVVVTADHETGGMALIKNEEPDKEVKMSFNTNSHSANMVGIFSYGPGAENFTGVMENYKIGRKLFSLLGVEKEWGHPETAIK